MVGLNLQTFYALISEQGILQPFAQHTNILDQRQYMHS